MVENHVMPAGNVDSNELDEKNPKWITGEYGGINEWDSSAAKYIDTLEEGQVVEPFAQFTMDGAKLTGNIQNLQWDLQLVKMLKILKKLQNS